VVVQEIEPRRQNFDTEAALRAVRGAIATEHELEVHAIVLVKAGEIPKTSSGKTRRSACRERYLSGQLAVIAEWKTHVETEEGGWDEQVALQPKTVTAREAERWLIDRIAARLHLPPSQVHVTTPFLEFGMGSVDAVEIAADLERWLGRRMSPTAVYNYPNIAALAQWLATPPTETSQTFKVHPAHPSLAEIDPEQLLHDVRHMSEADMQAFVLEEMAKQ